LLTTPTSFLSGRQDCAAAVRGKLIADDGNIIIHRFKVLKVPFVPQMSS
jgi:hypothetical protein